MEDQTKPDQHNNGTEEVADETNEMTLEKENCIESDSDNNSTTEVEETANPEQEVEELSTDDMVTRLKDEISHLKNEAEEQKDEISHLKNESEERFERFQRLSAEYSNYQKRMEQEIQKARRFSIDQFARAMLDVMESLDQACDIEQAEDLDPTVVAMREGMDLTRKQLLSAFESFGIEEVNPELGVAFDANFHQAMTMQPSTEIPPNHISEVYRKGYRLHDRLLRPAMVIVASRPNENTE